MAYRQTAFASTGWNRPIHHLMTTLKSRLIGNIDANLNLVVRLRSKPSQYTLRPCARHDAAARHAIMSVHGIIASDAMRLSTLKLARTNHDTGVTSG